MKYIITSLSQLPIQVNIIKNGQEDSITLSNKFETVVSEGTTSKMSDLLEIGCITVVKVSNEVKETKKNVGYTPNKRKSKRKYK